MDDHRRRQFQFSGGFWLLAFLSVDHANPVHRVTIIPRSIGALGATLQLPTEERYLLTRDELRDRICVMLGGRAAEEIDAEVRGILETEMARAREILARRRDVLEAMARRLLAVETLDRAEITVLVQEVEAPAPAGRR